MKGLRLALLLGLAAAACDAAPVWVWQGVQYFECATHSTYAEYCVTDTSLPTTYETLFATRWGQTADDVDQPYIAPVQGLFAFIWPAAVSVVPTVPASVVLEPEPGTSVCCVPVHEDLHPVPEPGSRWLLFAAAVAYGVAKVAGNDD